MVATFSASEWRDMGHIVSKSDQLQVYKSYTTIAHRDGTKNFCLFRVCIARTQPIGLKSLRSTKREETVVSAKSLKVKGPSSAGIGVEFQLTTATEWPVITSVSSYSRAMLSGLLDVGDLLVSVDRTSVKGLDITTVVQRILGPPNSRVELDILRAADAVDIPPSPVMVEPSQRKEIVVRRQHAAGPDSRSVPLAGLGILFHKVSYESLAVEHGERNEIGFPIIVQALTADGSACKNGNVFPGDIIIEIDGDDVRPMTMEDITEKFRGPPMTEVRLTLERGERYPIIFSHVNPNCAFRAPNDAYYVQIFRSTEPLGIRVSSSHAAGWDPTPVGRTSTEPTRDVHNIMHDGSGPGAKLIQTVAPNSPAGRCGQRLQGMLLHAVDGISVHGMEMSDRQVESLLDGPAGLPIKLLVSKPKVPPPPPPAPMPPPPVTVQVPVERVVHVEKPVEVVKYVDRPVDRPVYVDRHVELPPKVVEVERTVYVDKVVEPPPRVVEVERTVYLDRPVERTSYLDRVVEVPVEIERIVDRPVDRVVEVPVEKQIHVPVEKPIYIQVPPPPPPPPEVQYIYVEVQPQPPPPQPILVEVSEPPPGAIVYHTVQEIQEPLWNSMHYPPVQSAQTVQVLNSQLPPPAVQSAPHYQTPIQQPSYFQPSVGSNNSYQPTGGGGPGSIYNSSPG